MQNRTKVCALHRKIFVIGSEEKQGKERVEK